MFGLTILSVSTQVWCQTPSGDTVGQHPNSVWCQTLPSGVAVSPHPNSVFRASPWLGTSATFTFQVKTSQSSSSTAQLLKHLSKSEPPKKATRRDFTRAHIQLGYYPVNKSTLNSCCDKLMNRPKLTKAHSHVYCDHTVKQDKNPYA